MKLFDISRTLSSQLAPWPGDTPFTFELKWKMAEGATVNVGAINMSVHNGTHADATFHFDPNGPTIEQMPLGTYIGPALVVDLTEQFEDADTAAKANRQISRADLMHSAGLLRQAPRLLLKTGIWKDSSVFPKWIPVISSDVPAWIGAQGVRLLALDLPSVDAIEAKELRNHHALAAAGVAIVESLDLEGIEAGLYEFAALPLKIGGGDGAPLRAILWRA
jgi:arylformamidase